YSQKLIARYPQAKLIHVTTTIKTTSPGVSVFKTPRKSLSTSTLTNTKKIADHLIAPATTQTKLPSPSDTSSPVPTNDNTSYGSPISDESFNKQNDSSSTKYIIIGISAAIGIILFVSMVFIFKKLCANRRLKRQNVHAHDGNSRGLDPEFRNENSFRINRIENTSLSSQQGTNYVNDSVQSYNAPNGNERFDSSYHVLYPAKSHYKGPYPVRSDYSDRSGCSSPVDSNYCGHAGGYGQGYHFQHYNAQLVPPNQYYNPDPNFVATNFVPPGSIDRRMIRENILEIANDEDDTHESLGNHSVTENNTLFIPSGRESVHESLRLSLISENSRASTPEDDRSQTNQKAVYF
ncbi:2193_t:CDS:1, partial [Racocetra fulgida]